MSADQTNYDIFISYSRRDNNSGWVKAIRDHIAADHRQFSTAPLRIFFDTQEIKDADDWRHRILGALRQSKMLLVCLSPNYFASEYCRWEWEEYVKRQVHQLMGSESVATIYFIEVPNSNEQANAKRMEELMRGNYTDLRPFFPDGADALQSDEVRRRMARLGESLWERLQRARRAVAVPGNLRWQNPHFVGRNEELRRLHQQLGTGAVGVVTAVHGLGGQGKTELAVAYAHGWADSYPAGLWSLAAEGKKELLPLIGELAWERSLGFTPTDEEKNNLALLGRGVLEHLKARAEAVKDSDPDRGAATLILLDNVSESELLSPAQLATLPGGMGAGWLRIVATTRLDLREQKDRLALLAVDALDAESAVSLIRDHQPPRDAQRHIVNDLTQGQPQFANDEEEAAARAIVHALGGFTLAIEQVALYLGLHPDVSPSSFLKTLVARGLPVADTLPQRDPNVAAQMLTQSKHLTIILDATLGWLDAPSCTALSFAALLNPDIVPWPWLRSLTLEVHPLVGEKDDLGTDPWLSIQRRLSGLRLLTPGDRQEVTRLHRLVAAHLREKAGPQATTAMLAALLKLAGERASTLDATWVHNPENLWEMTPLRHLVMRLADSNRSSEIGRIAGIVGDIESTVGSINEAISLLTLAVEVHEDALAMPEASNSVRRQLSVSLSRLATAYSNRRSEGDSSRCDQAIQRALTIVRDAYARDTGSVFLAQALVTALLQQADSHLYHSDTKSLAKAKSALEEAHRIASSQTQSAVPWDAARTFNAVHYKMGRLFERESTLKAKEETSRWFRTYHAVSLKLWNAKPESEQARRDLDVASLALADAELTFGRNREAIGLLTECLGYREERLSRGSDSTQSLSDVAVSLDRLCRAWLRDQSPKAIAEALKYATRLHEITTRMLKRNPESMKVAHDMVNAWSALGDCYMRRGGAPDLEEAGAFYFKCAEGIRRIYAANPTEWRPKRDLAVALSKLGSCLMTISADSPDIEALICFRESTQLFESLLSDSPASVEAARDLATSYIQASQCAASNEQATEAARMLLASYGILRQLDRAHSLDDPKLRQLYQFMKKSLPPESQ